MKGHARAFAVSGCHPDKATHLGALVQGVATEQGEGLDVLGRRETGRHHPLLTPLGQLFAVLQHVAGDLRRDACLGLPHIMRASGKVR